MELIATRDAYGSALAKLGVRDDIIVLDADLSQSTKTVEFQKVNPSHFFNVGIAEQNLMGIAAGIATTGKISFASTFAIFATGRGFEVIRNSIAYQKLNVKIVATHSGLTVGEDGGSHQSVEDISIMRSIPNMTVIVPADSIETEKVIESIVEYNGPVYVRLGRPKIPLLFKNNYKFEIGKHSVLKTGDSLTIIACGIMVAKALEAAKKLADKNINAEVINASTIKPFDNETLLTSAKKTGCVVTAEEHSILGGLGGAVCELLSRKYPIPVISIGIKDTFGESGLPDELIEKYGLTEECIYEGAVKALKKKIRQKGEN